MIKIVSERMISTVTMVGTSKITHDVKLPSSNSMHLQNQLCTYVEVMLSEPNFDRL